MGADTITKRANSSPRANWRGRADAKASVSPKRSPSRRITLSVRSSLRGKYLIATAAIIALIVGASMLLRRHKDEEFIFHDFNEAEYKRRCTVFSCGRYMQCVDGHCIESLTGWGCSDGESCPDGMVCNKKSQKCEQTCKKEHQRRDGRGLCMCSEQSECFAPLDRCVGGVCFRRKVSCGDDKVALAEECRTVAEAVNFYQKPWHAGDRNVSDTTMLLHSRGSTVQLIQRVAEVLKGTVVPRHIWIFIVMGGAHSKSSVEVPQLLAERVHGVKIRGFATSIHFENLWQFSIAMRAATRFVAVLDSTQRMEKAAFSRLDAIGRARDGPAIIGFTGRKLEQPFKHSDMIGSYDDEVTMGEWFQSSCRAYRGGEASSFLSSPNSTRRSTVVDALSDHWFTTRSTLGSIFVRNPYSLYFVEEYTISFHAWKYAHVPTLVACPRSDAEFVLPVEHKTTRTDALVAKNGIRFQSDVINRMYFSGSSTVRRVKQNANVLEFVELESSNEIVLTSGGGTAVAVISDATAVVEKCHTDDGIFCIDAAANTSLGQMEDVVTSAHGVLCMLRPDQVQISLVSTPSLVNLLLLAMELYGEGELCEQ